MKFEKLPSGSLRFQSEPEDADHLADLKERCGGDDVQFLAELLEYTGWEPNGKLFRVDPVDVGGLTDAPMLTDDKRYDDDGAVNVHGPVWWFPNYMLLNFADRLIETGRVTFALGASAQVAA